jgi:large subunit ribosomal protein L22
VNEKASEKEVAAAKQAARAQGTTSVFETLPQAITKKAEVVVKEKQKERAAFVCILPRWPKLLND